MPAGVQQLRVDIPPYERGGFFSLESLRFEVTPEDLLGMVQHGYDRARDVLDVHMHHGGDCGDGGGGDGGGGGGARPALHIE